MTVSSLTRIDDPLFDLWRTIPWLEDAAPEVIHALAATAQRRAFDPEQMIFVEGDPCAGLYLIESGTVKIARYSKEGREHVLLHVHRGDTFNDVAAMDGGPNPATAIARTEVVAWWISRADLREVASRHSALAWAMIESMARRARHLVGIVQDLSMRSVRGRLARLLLDQAARGEGEAVADMLTQEEMAARLGTVREVVGRALRSLAATGVIEFDRHRIVILDPDRLADEAQV